MYICVNCKQPTKITYNGKCEACEFAGNINGATIKVYGGTTKRKRQTGKRKISSSRLVAKKVRRLDAGRRKKTN